MRLRLDLAGYTAAAVVFKRNHRVVCTDRTAPFRCAVRVPRGAAVLRISFVGETSLPRQALARVRVSR